MLNNVNNHYIASQDNATFPVPKYIYWGLLDKPIKFKKIESVNMIVLGHYANIWSFVSF